MVIKNEARLGKISEFSLCALAFTLPFSKSMVEIFFSCALVSCFLKKAVRFYCQRADTAAKIKKTFSELSRAFKPQTAPLGLPIFAFVTVAFFSVLASCSIQLSLKGFFFKLLEWVLLYFIVVDIIDKRAKFNRVLTALLLSMALTGADGLYQCVIGVDFLRGYSSGGNCIIQGPFASRNSFAGWLVIMIPLVISLIYIVKNRIVGVLTWSLAGILALCMVLTHSRGAVVAVLTGLVFFGFFNRRKTLLITMILLLVLSVVFLNYIKMHTSMIMISGFDRIGLWQEALGIIEDFPLLGCGINTYAAVGPYYRVSGGGGCYPHNSYLQMAAESGLLGLGAFFWVVVTFFRTAMANIGEIRDRQYGIILSGLLAGLFGFLVHSFVDVNIYTLQLGNLMWFIMGLAVAARHIALKDKRGAGTAWI